MIPSTGDCRLAIKLIKDSLCRALAGLYLTLSPLGCSSSPSSSPVGIPQSHCEPSAEVCDGRDNDCNGRIDEDLGIITCGVGECLNEVSACIAGKSNACSSKPRRHEICDNNRDDDCNGVSDEFLEDVGKEKQLVAVANFYNIATISANAIGSDLAVAWAGSYCTPAYFQRFGSSGLSSPVEIDAKASGPVVTLLGTSYSVFWSSCLTTRRGGATVGEVNATFGVPDVERGILQRTQLTDRSTYGAIARADAVWTGSEFGVAFVSGKRKGGGYLMRVSRDGRVLSQTLVSDPTTVNYSLVVAWHGDGFGLAWVSEQADGRALNYLQTDSNGLPIGSPTLVRNIGHPSKRLTPDLRSRPAIAWNGKSYALAWHDFRDSPPAATDEDREAAFRACPGCADLDWKRPSSTYFASISKEGKPIGASVRVASGARMEDPVMIWTGTEYGIVSIDADDVVFTRVQPGADPRSMLLRMEHPVQRVYSDIFDMYRLVWGANFYSLVWISNTGGIYQMGFKPGCDDESVPGVSDMLTR